jgi:histone H3/H4
MTTPGFLIPVRKLVREAGRFRFAAVAVLASPSADDLVPLGQLAEGLAGLGVRSRIERNAFGPAAVRIRRDASIAGAEAYRLTIEPTGIEILTSAAAGAYYAVQTLRELLAIHSRTLPACRIDDSPDFARRGVYLDCSRGKVPRVETLKTLVERLARWKINELQLYVENVFTWRRHPAIGRGFSPFTPEELLAVQDHCRRHHVRLVGSLASFGHVEKILALPQYMHLGEMPGFRGLPGGMTLCPSDPGSIRLVEELYEEFVPLFEAADFNVCCDETWELGKGRSRRQAERIGVGRVYLEFLKKVHRLCMKHGKRMNAWADIVLDHPEVLADVPRDIVMLNWDYRDPGTRISRTREITDAGLACMVCPGTNSWNSHGCRLDLGMRNIRRFAGEGLACRAEGLLNTDWGDNGHRNMLAVSLHNYAYGAAHGWNHRGVRDQGFTERFCRHTFGAAARSMPEAIRTLGGAHETLGLPDANDTLLYSTFLGSVREFRNSEDRRTKLLAAVKIASLAKHREALHALCWPRAAKTADPLLRTALEEFAVATRLDALACLRAAVLKRMIEGFWPPAAALRELAAETDSAAGELALVWLMGNKPSRLRDNLAGMRRAAGEYRRLARP